MIAAAVTELPWAQVLAEGITPNLPRMIDIWNAGKIAVLFFDVDGTSQGYAECGRRCFDWKGKRIELSRMTQQGRTRFVNAIGCAYEDRKPVARWLRRKTGQRLIVFVHDGVLCLNFDPDRGFSLDPGT